MIKPGDKVRGIAFKGAVVVERGSIGNYPLLVNGLSYTTEGFLEREHAYPSIWLADSGHGPEVGERPVWKPTKPTPCKVWDYSKDSSRIEVVIGYIEENNCPYKTLNTAYIHAEPCEPPAEWNWPEEWLCD